MNILNRLAHAPDGIKADLRRNLMRDNYLFTSKVYVSSLLLKDSAIADYVSANPDLWYVLASATVEQGMSGEYSDTLPVVIAKYYMKKDSTAQMYRMLQGILKTSNVQLMRQKLSRLLYRCIKDGHNVNLYQLGIDLSDWSQTVKDEWIMAIAENCSSDFFE